MSRSRKRKLRRCHPAVASLQIASTLLAGTGGAMAQQAASRPIPKSSMKSS